jgi:hypothetical protein
MAVMIARIVGRGLTSPPERPETMRLTLRTLLAYADNILDPKDAQEIAQKIEESDFAKGLLSRTRDLLRRLRLAAPEVNQRGQGVDPNTVAEYLDNTLSGERVADFEKVCLDSDIQLAEVASCHQILALVLGEPADIEPASRQRMYQLLRRDGVDTDLEAAAVAAVGTPQSLPPEEKEADKPLRAKPVIPDYLREAAPVASSANLLPVLATVVLGVLLLILVLGALGQFESGTLIGNWIHGAARPPEPVVQAADKGTPASPTTVLATSAAAAPASGTIAAAASGAPAATSAALTLVPSPSAATATLADTGGANRPTTVASAAVAGVPPSTVAPAPTVPAAGTTPVGTGTTVTLKMAASGTPAPPAAPVVRPGEAPGSKNTEVAMNTPAKLGGGTPVAVKPAEEKVGETAPVPAEQVGRLADGKQVLLAYDPATGWQRVVPQGAVNTSVRLLSLPAYQPVIALRVPLTVQLLGGTEVEFLSADAQGTAGINVQYGRVIIRAVGDAKPRLRLQVGHREALVTFQNADSTVALIVGRSRVGGTNPEAEPGVLKAEMFAVGGRLLWAEAGGVAPLTISAPAQLRLGEQGGETPVALTDLPNWTLGADDTSPLDKRAAPRVEQAVEVNRAVVLCLRELVDVSQREVAWLAIRSLGYVGEFEPMVAVLNSADQHAVWDDYLAQLQFALARGPETAVQVRQAFEKQYGKNAALLYRMLWGYTEADIQGGAGGALVECLDHEILAFRVLAFYNLEKFTGVRFGYRPYDPPAKRQPTVIRWRDRLNTGLLAPKPGEPPKKAAPPPAPGNGL